MAVVPSPFSHAKLTIKWLYTFLSKPVYLLWCRSLSLPFILSIDWPATETVCRTASLFRLSSGTVLNYWTNLLLFVIQIIPVVLLKFHLPTILLVIMVGNMGLYSVIMFLHSSLCAIVDISHASRSEGRNVCQRCQDSLPSARNSSIWFWSLWEGSTFYLIQGFWWFMDLHLVLSCCIIDQRLPVTIWFILCR